MTEPWYYAHAGLVGFIAGIFVFLASLLVVTISYFDQLYLLLACVGTCVMLALTATFVVNHRLRSEASRIAEAQGYPDRRTRARLRSLERRDLVS